MDPVQDPSVQPLGQPQWQPLGQGGRLYVHLRDRGTGGQGGGHLQLGDVVLAVTIVGQDPLQGVREPGWVCGRPGPHPQPGEMSVWAVRNRAWTRLDSLAW